MQHLGLHDRLFHTHKQQVYLKVFSQTFPLHLLPEGRFACLERENQCDPGVWIHDLRQPGYCTACVRGYLHAGRSCPVNSLFPVRCIMQFEMAPTYMAGGCEGPGCAPGVQGVKTLSVGAAPTPLLLPTASPPPAGNHNVSRLPHRKRCQAI